jgi:DNA primase
MPGVDFNLVRERTSMADVLRLLEFHPTSVVGDAWRGPCPVHGSTTPRSRSFSVNVRLGRYRCFRCGSRGNALELWAAVQGIGVYDAAVGLCEALGIDVPWIKSW